MFTLILLILLFSACSIVGKDDSENKTTNTWSTSFDNQLDKVDFLKQYLICPSEVFDTEYHIEYHDNSRGLIPGPSDWDIIVAVKVNTNDIPLWVDDMAEISHEQINTKWWDDLQLENENWDLSSQPVCYKRANSSSYIAVYDKAGIILKYVSTMPTN